MTTPFIIINAKKLTSKLKACITNQYLPVSSSRTQRSNEDHQEFDGERNDSSRPGTVYRLEHALAKAGRDDAAETMPGTFAARGT